MTWDEYAYGRYLNEAERQAAKEAWEYATEQAEAVTVERCAQSIDAETWLKYPGKEVVHTALSQARYSIRALQPNPTWLEQHDAEVERQARRDEAKWWEHLAQEHHDNSHKGETCMYCQRLKALAPESGKGNDDSNE